MQVGSIGDVVFEVSDSKIMTFEKWELEHSASISVHAVHLGGGLAEFTGDEPQTLTIPVKISKYLGASVWATIRQLDQYLTDGEPKVVILGRKRFGRYKWLIQSLKVTGKYFDGKGILSQADVSISLLEYLR